MEKDQGKVIVGVFLATMFSVISQAAFADMGANQQVLDQVGGQYGANLNNATGAAIESNGTYANITNTQTNSVLNWNSLNTAPGQTLNFTMTDGQTSLNRVISPQLSKFAGNLTSTGGRVIISNPMGMIFENGSYTNVNALTLTTHDAQMVGNKLILDGVNVVDSQGITIGGVGASPNAAVMRVAEDLNIVSNGIKVENADIFAGNANFVTADGVTFVASDMTVTNANNSHGIALQDGNGNDVGNIYVKNSVVAVKDNTSGRIFIESHGDTAGVKVAKAALDGNTQLNVDGNVDMAVIGNADIVDSYVRDDLTVKTVDDTITLTNSGSFFDLTDYVYTMDDYFQMKFHTPSYTKSQVKAFLKVTEQGIADVSSDVVDYIFDNASNLRYGDYRVSYDFATSTSYSGNGAVTVKDTNIGGYLTVEGAKVTLSDIVAFDYTANAVGTNGAYSSRNDKLYENEHTRKYWTNHSYYKDWVKTNNNNFKIVYEGGDQLFWDETNQTWIRVSNGQTDLPYFLVENDRYYYTENGKNKVIFDTGSDNRWEYNTFDLLSGLSLGYPVAQLGGVSNVTTGTINKPTYTPGSVGVTLANYTYGKVVTGTNMVQVSNIKETTSITNQHGATILTAAIDAGSAPININNVITTKPVPSTPVTPPVNPSLNAGDDDSGATLAYDNDHDKDLYGIEVNAVFQRQFSPRGFAASDDELKARMNRVKQTATEGVNKSIILNERFTAE